MAMFVTSESGGIGLILLSNHILFHPHNEGVSLMALNHFILSDTNYKDDRKDSNDREVSVSSSTAKRSFSDTH